MNTIFRHLKAILTVFPLFVAVFLSGCGGGGGGSASGVTSGSLTGVFSDAPVVGLSYSTSAGANGTTNSQGQFQYASGDTVTFSVGGLTLGSAKPSVTSAGNTVVTPVDIVPGATDTLNSGVTAIGQLLGTLNSIAIANNSGSGGVFTIPSNATSLLATLGSTSAASITTTQLQSMVTTAAISGVSATTAADARANMNQGVNAANVIGTVWTGTCTCGGGGTFYFEPNGTLTGFTTSGDILAGTWSGSSTIGGGIQISLISSGGGFSKNGTIAAGSSTGTADIYSGSNVLQGTFTFTKVTSSSTLANTLYLGGWHVVYTPNATGITNGDSGGQGYVILFPNGNFSGITDGKQTITGTWNPSTGIGTGSLSGGGTGTFTVNVATRTGTLSKNGTVYGSLSFSRTGTLTMINGLGSGAPIPLLLNVHISWPANVGNVVSSFALSLNVYDSGSALIAGGIKSEANPMGIGAAANTTTDNIAVSYRTGSAATYSLSVGPSNCTMTGGSGTVVDMNNNNPGAYPTVNITCN